MMQIYRMAQLDISQDTMQLDTFLDFILSEILPNKTYSAVIDADMTSQIYDGKAQLDQNRDLLLGEHYNRMIVSTDFPTEGSNTFAGMEEIQNAAESTLQESYLVGDSAMAYEMNNGFQKELDFVTFLTVIAVFVVVLFTFLMTQKIIAQTCTIIACGAAVSVIMVLFVLPAILYLTDKIIVRHRGK